MPRMLRSTGGARCFALVAGLVLVAISACSSNEIPPTLGSSASTSTTASVEDASGSNQSSVEGDTHGSDAHDSETHDSDDDSSNDDMTESGDEGAVGSSEAVADGDGETAAGYIANLNLDGQFSDAVLLNRSPDCRDYAIDANEGDYSSSGVDDISTGRSDSESHVSIDLVTASDWNNNTYNYNNVAVASAELATHCRMTSNMIPNHTFGVEVTGPRGEGWINEIDHGDIEVTYIPIDPEHTGVASDTPRNPPIYDFDGILLNGVGIAMDSGFCYNPGVTTGPASLRSNPAGNSSGCGPRNSWFELPAFTIWDEGAQNMAAVFDDYFAHGFVGTYHYHAITHPLQADDDQTAPPADGKPSPVIGFAPDGFPIYGHWFINESGALVRAESGYEIGSNNSRTPISTALHGTPPTPWDIANNPQDFASNFGLELGRYEEDWHFEGTGNLDECNGATDVNGDYGYYVTDKYPFSPPCTFGLRDPSFGKVSPTLG